MGDSKRPLRDYNEYMTDAQRSDKRFCATWLDWLLDRVDRRKPVTERAAKIQLKKLAAMKNPIASIEQSIENHWQGLFPTYGDKTAKRDDWKGQALGS